MTDTPKLSLKPFGWRTKVTSWSNKLPLHNCQLTVSLNGKEIPSADDGQEELHSSRVRFQLVCKVNDRDLGEFAHDPVGLETLYEIVPRNLELTHPLPVKRFTA